MRTSPRHVPRTVAAVLATMFILVSASALADCADVAAPGVNWRRCLFDGRDLAGVNLKGAQLRDTTFGRAVMDKADLSETDAYRAKFISTRMPGARLDGARLIEADFTRADLSNASFVGADLRNVKLIDANLRGADFTNARLQGLDLRNADLSHVRWSDGQKICAESSIGQCN